MNTGTMIATGAFALLVGVAGAADRAVPCDTNACACARARIHSAPTCPLTLKLEKETSDADVVTFKAAVLARIDEAVKTAKAENAKGERPPATIRLVVDDGRHGPPPMPPGGRCGMGRRHNSRHGERPEPPPDGMPPPERPQEQ